MFRCPFCGAMARTRTSRKMTLRQYHQCQNLECSRSFTTLNSVEREVTKRAGTAPLPPDFIPRDAFPASHYGNNQLSLII
ncbi:ogr/Delta-like zinc finger family protein [Enterobacter hormaechei]|uniref:ogr/Delta-like zinc finger family protein n=1 Tax=Enterobacter hormaechei TaxID=158836 RepID=UPI0023E3E791|nr:ogr/Delta-like zinc finger family protein [Enterobacter hormaechei]MDF3706492.1 ogr/Delta-like zinc finger family protein [Enterobacter hormaechei]